MKIFKISIIIFISVISFSSCEKEYLIGKTFKDKITDKPIVGLMVGLYKFDKWLGPEKQKDSVELIGTSKTDSTGLVVFTFKDDDLQFTISSYFFLPLYTTDTTSVNAKFRFKLSDDYPNANWEPNETIYLYPYYDIELVMSNIEENEPLKLKYDGSYYNLLFNGSSYFHLFLRPGEFHKLEFYKEIDSRLTLIETKSVYVKYQNIESIYLFSTSVPYSVININLGQ